MQILSEILKYLSSWRGRRIEGIQNVCDGRMASISLVIFWLYQNDDMKCKNFKVMDVEIVTQEAF